MSYFVTVDRPAGEAYIHAGANRLAAFSGGQLGPFASADVAAQEAVLQSTGSIVFGSGTHVFLAPVTVSRTREIRIPSDTTLIPGHTGSIGLFEFTAERCALVGGGAIVANTEVADQVLVKFTGCLAPVIRDVSIDFNFSDSSDVLQHVAGTVAGDSDVIAVNLGAGYAAGSTSMVIDVDGGSSMWIIGDKFTLANDSTGTVYTTTNSGQVSQSQAVGEADVIAVDNGAGYAAATTTMNVDVDSGTSTFTIGDRFTIAGETETFICLNSGTFNTTGVDLNFYPSLSTTVANNAVITFVVPTVTFTPGLAEAASDDDALTFSASAVSPMMGLVLENCIHATVEGTRVYPAKGTTGWYSSGGSFLKFAGNHYGTKTGGSLLINGGPEWTYRKGYRALEINGTEYFNVGADCTFFGAGNVEHPSIDWDFTGLNSDGDDNVLDKMIYIYSSNTGGAGLPEEGHSVLHGFIAEGVDVRNTVHITGQQFFDLDNFRIGAGSGAKVFNLASRLDCAVRIEIQGNKGCPNFVMNNVKIHNAQWGVKGSTSPPQVYVSGVNQGSEIKGCSFNLVQKGAGIIVRHGNVTDLSIHDNTFDAVETGSDQPTSPIRMIALGARLETGHYHEWYKNLARGFEFDWNNKESLPLGFGGANPVGRDYDTNLSFPTLGVTITLTAGAGSADPTISDPAAAGSMFDNIEAGDIIYLTGPVGVGTPVKSSAGLFLVSVKNSANSISLARNSFFTDVVATEASIANCNIYVFPRTLDADSPIVSTPQNTNRHPVRTAI